MNYRLSLLVACTLAATPSAARGGEAGLDLVLLIDRSGSMVRHDVEPLIGLVAEVVARNAEANDVTHRLARVSFASSVTIDVPLMPVGPRGREEWRTHERHASGHTDILAAFRTASRLFETQPSRKRAILLITDGILSVPGVSRSGYEADLTRFVAEHLHDVSVHVALLPNVRLRLQELWRTLSGNRAHDIDEPADLHEIAANLAGTRVQESRGNAGRRRIVLPPYLDSVVFDVFRGRRGDAVAVFAPGATQPLRTDDEDVEEVRLSETISSIVVRNPPPGVWTFRTRGADSTVRVFSQEFFPRGLLVSPAPLRPLPLYSRPKIAYRIVGRDGKPLAELPAYPLSIDMRLSRPDGSAISLAMRRDPDPESSAFEGVNVIACDAVGRYWTEARVFTTDVEQRRVSVFADRWSGFSVTNGPSVNWQSVAPVMRVAPREIEGARPRAGLLGAAAVAVAIGLAIAFVLRKPRPRI
jgi:hypothetical protein